MLGWSYTALSGLLAFTALANWLFMRRPTSKGKQASLCILIPARDESANLKELLPILRESDAGIEIYVFDDESSDDTADVARSFGAKVVSPSEPLPMGWTGKNRACDALGRSARDSSADWWLFLDADVRPEPGFLSAVRRTCAAVPDHVGVVTGFGKVVPGEGLEPLFLAWVGWILFTTNPFWIVSKTGKGHNFFTNGQIHAWRREVYEELRPNESLKSAILEDVRIGRLLARKGVGVEVILFTHHLKVEMYKTWKEALDGMTKNSYEIGGKVGTWLLAALFVFLALGFLIGPNWLGLGLLMLSGLFVAVGLRVNPMVAPIMPIVCLIGAFTLIRSWWWRQTGRVTWKGRTY